MNQDAKKAIAAIDKIFMNDDVSAKTTLKRIVAIRDYVRECVDSLDADLGNKEPS